MADTKTDASAQANTDSAAGKGTEAGKTAATDATGATKDAGQAGEATKGTADATGATQDAGKETAGKAGETTQPKAPEKYTLTVPEDAQAFVDDGILKQVETLARASDLSNEDANAVLEEHIAMVRAQSDRWKAEATADPEYGGDKLAETQRLAKLAIDRVRPVGHARREAFNRFLNRGGAGNHVEVVAFLADLGKLMGEDTPGATRSSTGAGAETAESKLYDHETSKKLDGRA